MTAEEYKDAMDIVAQDPHLLPGIYNFCDQWCDRCNNQDRCFTFRMRKLTGRVQENNDPDDNQWIEDVEAAFGATRLILEEEFEKMGITMDETKEDTEQIAVMMAKSPYKTGDWPEYITEAQTYGFDVLKWLSTNKEIISDNLVPMISISDEEAEKINYALETIQRYALVIQGKMRMAYSARVEVNDFDRTGYANGQMKTGIEIVEKSIQSMQVLLEVLPSQETEILNFLQSLSFILKEANQMYPDATGFDFDKYCRDMEIE
ncbi:MAG TPA: hypothetical protein DC042_07665 [Bacteroidales bacterium]|nr:hypothetical protein [Bacteroidales bacterium]